MIAYFNKFHRVVWLQMAGHAITSFVSIILLPFLTLYMYEQFGDNIVLTTLVIGVQPITEIVLTFLLGGWIDKIGRRPVMLWSLLIQVVAIGGFALADQVWAFALFTFLNGAGRFVYIPAARAQIAETVPAGKQAETFALLSTASSIGSLGGPVIGAILFQINQQLLFIILALVVFLYFLLSLKFIPETNLLSSTKDSPHKLNWHNYKTLGWLAVGMLPLSLFHAQMETNWPVYLKEHLTNYLFVFSLLETIGTIVFIALEVVLINRTSIFPRRIVILVGYLLYALASIGFGFFENIVGLIVSQVLLCLGAIVTLNHMQTLVSMLAPKSHKGRYFALFGLHWDISRSLGPFLGGLMLAGIGGEGLFLVIFLLIAIGGYSQTRAIQFVEGKDGIPHDQTIDQPRL